MIMILKNAPYYFGDGFMNAWGVFLFLFFRFFLF